MNDINTDNLTVSKRELCEKILKISIGLVLFQLFANTFSRAAKGPVKPALKNRIDNATCQCFQLLGHIQCLGLSIGKSQFLKSQNGLVDSNLIV